MPDPTMIPTTMASPSIVRSERFRSVMRAVNVASTARKAWGCGEVGGARNRGASRCAPMTSLTLDGLRPAPSAAPTAAVRRRGATAATATAASAPAAAAPPPTPAPKAGDHTVAGRVTVADPQPHHVRPIEERAVEERVVEERIVEGREPKPRVVRPAGEWIIEEGVVARGAVEQPEPVAVRQAVPEAHAERGVVAVAVSVAVVRGGGLHGVGNDVV